MKGKNFHLASSVSALRLQHRTPDQVQADNRRCHQTPAGKRNTRPDAAGESAGAMRWLFILLLRIAGKKIPAQGGLKFVTEETSALTVDRNACVRFIN